MNDGLIFNNNKVTLCNRGAGKCCPVMEYYDEEHVKITDDFGNSIIVKNEEATLMAKGVDTIKENREKLLFD